MPVGILVTLGIMLAPLVAAFLLSLRQGRSTTNTTEPRRADRILSGILFLEFAYLLVPWQAVVHGRFNFSDNENLGIWSGAAFTYFAARLAWTNRLRGSVAVLFVVGWWGWFTYSLRITYSPYHCLNCIDLSTRLLRALIGWIPVVNAFAVSAFSMMSVPARSTVLLAAIISILIYAVRC